MMVHGPKIEASECIERQEIDDPLGAAVWLLGNALPVHP